MDIQLKKKPWYIRYRHYLLAGAAFLTLAVYVIVLAIGPRRLQIDAEAHRIAEVTNAPFMEYVDVEGFVQPIQIIRLSALESGFVERIVAEDGALLEAGDTILVLSNPELLRTIADEQTEWQNQQRNFHEQEIAMEKLSITLREQTLDTEHELTSLEKTMALNRKEFEMGIKSKAEMAMLEEDYDYRLSKARLQMESLRYDSVSNRLKQEMLRAARETSLCKLTRSTGRLANLVCRAPVAGQLSFLNVTLGQQVSPGTSIGEIKVLTAYKIHTMLPEYYIDRITTDLPASIQYQGQKYPLRVSRVVSEVKERSFECDLQFTADKPSNIRLGKSYRVQIELGSPEDAVVIPRGDFYQVTAGRWIYRLSSDGNSAHKVSIEIGRQNPEQFEIVSGLQAGDKVIVSGYDKLGEAEALLIK